MRGWAGVGATITAVAVVGLGVYFVTVGLDAADKLASVLGLFVATSGLVLASVSGPGSRRRDTELPQIDESMWDHFAQAIMFPRPGDLPRDVARPVTEATARPGLVCLPISPEFVGRNSELDTLDDIMNSGEPMVLTVVHGLGGVGKSTLAARFAGMQVDRFNPVWWISANSPSALREGLAELAVELQPELRDVLPIDALMARAVSWLSCHSGWLLVLDDVSVPADLMPLLERLREGRVLVTSRLSQGWNGLGARVLPVDVLTDDEATELVMRVAPRRAADEMVVTELCRELGCLPLAVGQAASYLSQNDLIPVRVYLDSLMQRPELMFDRTAQGSDDERTVLRIWRITLDKLASTSPLAVELLRITAWWAPKLIPTSLLMAVAEPIEVTDALGVLRAYNMIGIDGDLISVHPMIQTVARSPDPIDPHRRPGDVADARDRATLLLDQARPTGIHDPADWPEWRLLLPHIDALVDRTSGETDTPVSTRLLNETAVFLGTQGVLSRALVYLERALDSDSRLHGNAHPATMTSRHNLANAHKTAGNLNKATSLFEEALADRRRVLGEDHPDTLYTMASLACALEADGQLDTAVRLFEQTVADLARVLGDDHPHTLLSRNDLAFTLKEAGRVDMAVALFERTLADRRRILGPDHPHTLVSSKELAEAYFARGDLEQAVVMFEETLAACEHTLGTAHPLTRAVRADLAAAV
ncbi:tetratricopeptide repeat protein [Actinomadura soli]|nr:tetratricopeptide repeat protein [Actinomadura soli]